MAESNKLTVLEKEQFKGLLHIEKGKFIFDKDTFTASLKLLSQLLYKHYGQKVVILIDEYDVPLDKAYQNGYYHDDGLSHTRLVRTGTKDQRLLTVCYFDRLSSHIEGKHIYRIKQL